MFTWIACKDWNGQSVQKKSDIISKNHYWLYCTRRKSLYGIKLAFLKAIYLQEFSVYR